jgi:hypothetical protein
MICDTAIIKFRQGRVIVQTVSHRLPTAAVRVRVQLKLCGICGGQSDIGAGFVLVLRFPLPIFIPLTSPPSSSSSSSSSSIIRGWYKRPISGRRTKGTQSQPTPRKPQKNEV